MGQTMQDVSAMRDSLQIAIALSSLSGKAETVEHTVHTRYGTVAVLADLSVLNDKLTLSDLCVYPAGDWPVKKGHVFKELLREVRVLLDAAKALGYVEVEVLGKRAANSSAAQPNRVIFIKRRLR